MKRTLFSLFLLVALMATASAQKRLINDHWQFVRLSGDTAAWKAGKQGTSWQSQFSVEIRDGKLHSSLTLKDSLIAAEWKQLGNAQWQSVRLPHTAYMEPLTIVHPWQGICYYQRDIHLGKKDLKGQTWIEFEGVMQLADIWINGKHAMQHAGGFTTFVVDATPYLHEGKNTILVRADNQDNPLIPPGKPLSRLDFCYHSGIYRDVYLIHKGNVLITHPLLAQRKAGGGIFVTYPKVTQQEATVNVKTEVENKTQQALSLTLRQRLYPTRHSSRGRMVAEAIQKIRIPAGTAIERQQALDIRNPRLWFPDAPQLYQLETEILSGNRVLDRECTTIGIRRFEVTKEKGLLVNGKPYYLCGTNRHQEYPYVGNAISDNAQFRDVYQMRDNGFNIVRLGHYPQDPSVLDACDELGLLAIEPIPGWQFFNKDSLFIALTYHNVRELIRRDRNHPSILMWETTLNESWPPAWWKDQAIAVAHEEMPGDQCLTSGDCYGYNRFDICYNDWDDDTFSRPNKSGKPSFIREYYDYEFGGDVSTSRFGRKDGIPALIQNLWNAQWSYNQYRDLFPNTIGCAVWSMYDYNRGCCDNICESGVADIFRLPKFSLPFFRLQTPAHSYTPSGKMPYDLFCTAYGKEADTDTLLVYGNVDEVALSIGGKRIATQRADNGPTTSYVSHPDKGNCKNLTYPPFTFTGLKGYKGDLSLTGYWQGKEVAKKVIECPGEPQTLGIQYFESGKPAGQNDLLIVYVSLLDHRQNCCPINGEPISLSALSGGKVMGPSSYATEAGVASFLVSTSEARQLTLQATWKGHTVKKTIVLAQAPQKK